MMDFMRKISKKRILLFILILSLAILWTGCGMKDIGQESPQNSEETPREEIPRIEEITMAAVGDIMVHSPQFEAAYVGGEEKYDFYPTFQPIEKYIQETDIAVANLETTFAGEDKGYTGYPMFNSPEQLGKALKQTGFDVITTANNHSLDRRSQGVKSTLDFLDQEGLDYTGTARSQEERDRILIKEVKNVKIAFLAYTYGTNGIPLPEDEPYLVNLIDKTQIEEDIQRAKAENPDIIVASMHFGVEYQRTPNDEQKELVDFLAQQGVDVILGSHPHVIQPMEIKNVVTAEGEEKEVFVIYSMGNFISNQRDRYTDSGLILQMGFEKNFKTNKTVLKQVEYIPTWVNKTSTGGKLYYEVVAVEEAMKQYENNESKLISKEGYNLLQRTWNDTTSHLEQENAKMVLKPLE
ncbi:CapA family protein [Irregularibacter muris]|uniref:CapA family protein n=2 Tax=Irregularibacter muris TaxID=1796619 RepID=A0AAE3L3X8_9FIRM|nr:CapA family protein [Irregularibacter muris]